MRKNINQDHGYCSEYFHNYLRAGVLKRVYSLLVTIKYEIVIFLAILLVKKIGFHTNGEEILNICYLVFFGQFLNSFYLVILSSMNFKGTILESLSIIGLNGPFDTLSEEWYNKMAG